MFVVSAVVVVIVVVAAGRLKLKMMAIIAVLVIPYRSFAISVTHMTTKKHLFSI